MPHLSRRTFVHGAVTLVCAPPLLEACAPEAPQPTVLDGWTFVYTRE